MFALHKKTVTRLISPTKRVTILLEINDMRMGHGAYFSVTHVLEEKARNHRWYERAYGAGVEQYAAHFPEIARFFKWHLVSFVHGPMHYKANALYWAGYGSYLGWNDGNPDSPPNLERFKTTIVYGALETDTVIFPNPQALLNDPAWDGETRQFRRQVLEAWLDSRPPELMELFRADMIELFGVEIRDKFPVDLFIK